MERSQSSENRARSGTTATGRSGDRPEVDLGLLPGLLLLRREPLQAPRPLPVARLDLRAAPRDALRDVGARRRRVVLVAQPRPDAPDGTPLLARRAQVLRQHRVDQRRDLIPRGRRPLRNLPRGPAPATPATPAQSAGAPRASGRFPGSPCPSGDPRGSQRTRPRPAHPGCHQTIGMLPLLTIAR